MFHPRFEMPQQPKCFRSALTASLLLMAGFNAIAQEPNSQEQLDNRLSEVVKLGEAIVKDTTTHLPAKEKLGEYNATSTK